jgi:hypothetical protein
MKIELIKELTNHKIGTILNLAPIYANSMIKNGVAKKYEPKQEVELFETQLPEIAPQKPKGRPKK